MRRALALELATLVVVCAGMLACSALGGWFSWAAPIAAALALIAPAIRERLPRLPWAPLTGIAAVLGIVVPWGVGADLLGVLAGSLIGLQLSRRFGRASSSDDRASAVLALLMIVLAATADPTVEVGVSAMLWVLGVAPLAMLSHLVREGPDRRRSVSSHLLASAGLVALVATLVFLALPRLRGADLGPLDGGSETGHVGFRDEVQLGEVGSLLDDPTPVLRVTTPTSDQPLTHLRGIVLDRFDGRGWLATFPDAQAPSTPPPGSIPVRVQAEAAAGVVAFAPGPISAISDSTVEFLPDHAGNWRLQVPPRRLTYTAWMADPDLPDEPSPRWTQLPMTSTRGSPSSQPTSCRAIYRHSPPPRPSLAGSRPRRPTPTSHGTQRPRIHSPPSSSRGARVTASTSRPPPPCSFAPAGSRPGWSTATPGRSTTPWAATGWCGRATPTAGSRSRTGTASGRASTPPPAARAPRGRRMELRGHLARRLE